MIAAQAAAGSDMGEAPADPAQTESEDMQRQLSIEPDSGFTSAAGSAGTTTSKDVMITAGAETSNIECNGLTTSQDTAPSEKNTAFHVDFEDPHLQNMQLSAPRRLPRLEKLEKKRSSMSKAAIEEKAAMHDQRRQQELNKRADAQKNKQSKRDRLRAEVKTAREMEAKQKAAAEGGGDELDEGLPKDSCTDLLKADVLKDGTAFEYDFGDEGETMPPESEEEDPW